LRQDSGRMLVYVSWRAQGRADWLDPEGLGALTCRPSKRGRLTGDLRGHRVNPQPRHVEWILSPRLKAKPRLPPARCIWGRIGSDPEGYGSKTTLEMSF